MSAAVISFRESVLPWNAAAVDEERFRRIWRTALVLALLFGISIPFWPVIKTTVKPGEVPPVVAKLLIENKPQPEVKPPPPPKVEAAKPEAAKPEAAEQAKAEPPKPEAAKPLPPKPQGGKQKVLEPKPNQPDVTEARNPQPNKPPGEDLASARRKASGVGLLAMKDQLADLRGAPVAVQLKENIKPGPGVGTTTGVGVGMGTEPGLPTRNLVTSNATNGSGGINTNALSRDTGGGGLAGRSTTLVAGVAGGGGGGGFGGGGGGKGGLGGTDNGRGVGSGGPGGGGKGGAVQRDGSSGKASRSLEEIRIVFDRNKGSIYAIYNRALREDASLQGKVVVELKIAPEGNVISARLVSSELKNPELESKLLARIRSFDFGAKDVNVMTVSYPLDFLPS
jgi:TonB family protein